MIRENKKKALNAAVLLLSLGWAQTTEGAYIDDGTTQAQVTAGDTYIVTGTSYIGPIAMSVSTGVLQASGVGSVLDARGVTYVKESNITVNNTNAILALDGGNIELGSLTVDAASGTSYGVAGWGGLVTQGAGSSIHASGDVTVNTTGGAVSRGTDGVSAFTNSTIQVDGTLTVMTTGSDGTGARAQGVGALVVLQDIKTDTIGNNAHGINAMAGGKVTAKQVDIYIHGGAQAYAYGLLANSALYSANPSIIEIEGGTIKQEATGGISGFTQTSNSAVRALEKGVITVSKDLIISTNGFGARGAYASEQGIINLNNTQITTKGSSSMGIQVGKSRAIGTGPGVVNSIGALKITTNNASSAGLFLEGNGSEFNADSGTSSTIIDSAGRGIIYGGSSDALYQDSNVKVSIRNGKISTRNATSDLIYVGGRNIGSSLTLINSEVTSGVGGWLLNAVDRTITDTGGSGPIKGSVFTFKTDNTVMTGSINKETLSQLDVDITNGSIWNIQGRSGSLNEISTMTSLDIDNSTVNAYAGGLGNYTLNTGVTNLRGRLNLFDNMAGDTLTITGNYGTTDGGIFIDTSLGDDASATDRLVVNGDTTGNGTLVVKNAGGLGAQTVSGIEVIQVGGTSGGAFVLGGPLQAGAYEYALNQKGNNWYLDSTFVVAPPDTGGGDDPAPPIWRPGAVNYVAAQAANMEQGLLSLGTLHQRMGEQRLVSGGKQPWVRYYGDIQTNRGDDRFDYKQYVNGVQVGLDFYQKETEKKSVHSGIILDYAESHADISDNMRPMGNFLSSTGSMKSDSYGIGGYYTQINKNNSYLDIVGLVSKLDNDFTDSYGKDSSQDAYRLGLSVEAGKEFFRKGGWHYEGQAQLMYQYTNYDNFHDDISEIGGYGANALRGRIGLRVYKDMVSANQNRKTHVYGIANLVQDFINPRSVNVGGTNVNERFDKTFAEVGIGVQFQIRKNTFFYADARYEFSFEGGRESRELNVGFKTSF